MAMVWTRGLKGLSALALSLFVVACGGGGGGSTPSAISPPVSLIPSSQQAYVKASNTDSGDQFGARVAVSADGNTLAVGAPLEDSASAGINGNQTDNAASSAGAVYVYTRSGSSWVQQAYIKASNAEILDGFGQSVALSADGNTLVVGAPDEDSATTGINGSQADNTAVSAGAVYVYTRSGASWSQQAYVKASNTETGDQFGLSVALSADGNTLAVGAINESSAATGMNGNQADNAAVAAGAVYVYTRSGTNWAQQAYVKASNTEAYDLFGYSLSLNSDGNTLVVGAPLESSAATGINGNQADNTVANSGAVYVYTRSGANWLQQAYVKASNSEAGDLFGFSLSLNSDGNTLAVGAVNEASTATGINGNQADNAAVSAGAVYVYTRSGASWSQQAYVKASNTEIGDQFGLSVALNAAGNSLAVGATGEASAATGINGNQTDNSAANAGAVYVYTRSGTSWSQQAYIKASNTETGDLFGNFVALSSVGTLTVGARNEDSAATGINGNQAGNAAVNSGAVYVFQ